VARYSVSVSIEPTIAPPQYPIKTWQAEDSIEMPRPPDSPCYIKVRIRARFQISGARQYLYVVQQILLRELQATIGMSGLQIFNRKTPAFNYFLPEVNPAKAETACPIVEYPALAGDSGLRLMV
jgi:hypothetical protein